MMLTLTGFTPITPRRIFAPNTRNIACRRPSIEPRISAVDAEGICLFPFFTSVFSALLAVAEDDLHVLVFEPGKEIINQIVLLLEIHNSNGDNMTGCTLQDNLKLF